MIPRLLELVRRLHADGYQDVAGARASVTIPVSDRLVTRLVNEQLPPTAPVREIEIHAHADNRVSVRVRLSRPALLPPVSINLVIEQQPQLPTSPVFVLRVASGGGLMSLAGSAIRFLNVLPPGMTMEGDRIFVNLRTILEQRGAPDVFGYVDHLQVETEEGKLVISAHGTLPT